MPPYKKQKPLAEKLKGLLSIIEEPAERQENYDL